VGGLASYVLLAIGGTFLNVCVPVNVVMAQRLVPGGASTVSALMMGFAWGVGALLTPFTGIMTSRIGFANALIVVSLLPILAAALLIRFPRDEERGIVQVAEPLLATGKVILEG
jgi:FSR family fosmidomycin resistance protein-like MFS transporter